MAAADRLVVAGVRGGSRIDRNGLTERIGTSVRGGAYQGDGIGAGIGVNSRRIGLRRAAAVSEIPLPVVDGSVGGGAVIGNADTSALTQRIHRWAEVQGRLRINLDGALTAVGASARSGNGQVDLIDTGSVEDVRRVLLRRGGTVAEIPAPVHDIAEAHGGLVVESDSRTHASGIKAERSVGHGIDIQQVIEG